MKGITGETIRKGLEVKGWTEGKYRYVDIKRQRQGYQESYH